MTILLSQYSLDFSEFFLNPRKLSEFVVKFVRLFRLDEYQLLTEKVDFHFQEERERRTRRKNDLSFSIVKDKEMIIDQHC